ncbi:MAG TPA: SGNH/GDSL hydrolase family protein [Polyangia bacterium]|jgi:lysophospholipase L1-like esterase|nr:SGNH/GDSL hydrolase family protein [Polyangia bacterium]
MKIRLLNTSLLSVALAVSALAAAMPGAGCSGKDGDPFAGGDAGKPSGSGGATGNRDAGGLDSGGSGGAPAGSGGNTGVAGSGGGQGGMAGVPGTGGQAGGPAGGTPKPARMIILGDSITACSNVGGKTGTDCSINKLFEYVKANYAPNLVYENGAVGGAVTADVSSKQMPTVKTGAGHALVVIFVGGNDLAKYIFSSDTAATSGLAADLPNVLAAWDQIFATFNDKAKFPDGVTMVMNTQYTPFDECTAPPYNLSAKKSELLSSFNTALQDVAQKKGATITDQYTPFLGHGHHYMVMTCPHYMAGAVGWMADLIHPNAAGHADLFEQWKKVVDRLYKP